MAFTCTQLRSVPDILVSCQHESRLDDTLVGRTIHLIVRCRCLIPVPPNPQSRYCWLQRGFGSPREKPCRFLVSDNHPALEVCVDDFCQVVFAFGCDFSLVLVDHDGDALARDSDLSTVHTDADEAVFASEVEVGCVFFDDDVFAAAAEVFVGRDGPEED